MLNYNVHLTHIIFKKEKNKTTNQKDASSFQNKPNLPVDQKMDRNPKR